MVQLTGDCPTENPNGKMPLLDTEVWLEGNVVQYNDYREPCSNPLVMLEMSAMPAAMKRTALTQLVVKIRRNTRPELPWTITEDLLSNFSARMKASGYDEHYRYQVIKSGMAIWRALTRCWRRRGGEAGQSMLHDHGKRIDGRGRRSCNPNLGSGKVAMMCLSLSHTRQGRS